jgi:hypothetical protein
MERTEVDGALQVAESPARKLYRSPSLQTYGSVGSLTQALMLVNGVDGGNPGMSRTS